MTDDILTKDEAIDRMKAGLPCKTRCIGGWYATKWADFDDDENTYCKPPEPRRVAREWVLRDEQCMTMHGPIHVREVLPGDVTLIEALKGADKLSEIARLPNVEYAADEHNEVVRRLRALHARLIGDGS